MEVGNITANTRQKVPRSGFPDRITTPIRCPANGTGRRRGPTRSPDSTLTL